MEISGGPGPLETAAIIAALVQIEDERAAAAATPPSRPTQGKWVLSGRPRSVAPPTTRPAPQAEGWGAEEENL